ncbi:N-acetyldiaminopimelate deacetylase [Sporolactobacillus sp. CPB3-1]|uniref:N-acetyldiaminopimelate deacetylase n=1 Tax=Sporolactobacillus mangiferae TaxID=2940498 RepID=A0ABT0M8R4_9BACL|nr:N-acetyldiaminopimelate deacetylase [Sporolactobacillus mangiferae]MCL1630988.1 N-acetyldiaminopimelate deacetylase [Sporolactobacillus mangiferae]
MDYIAIRRALHQIPELGFEEVETQAFLLKQISELPQERIQVKKWRTGLLVRVTGTNPSKLIGFRTDIDALPVKENTGYSFQSRHEGNMHACGHDFHMTIALGALENIVLYPIKEDALFIFQPAEEGPGGALPMMDSEEFQAWKPDLIFALHVSPDFPAGTVATKEGSLFANTSELFIDFHGKGGHAANPHLTHDTIVAASHFVVGLQTIVARRVNPLRAAVLTIGKMSGGFKQNIIAESARVEGTIRTLSQDTMTLIKDDIKRHVRAIEMAYQCQGDIDFGANYYQVFNRKIYIDPFIDFCRKKAFPFVLCEDAMAGEDFGYFLKELPGFMFWLGVGKTSSLHSSDFKPDESALEQGVRVVSTYFREGI